MKRLPVTIGIILVIATCSIATFILGERTGVRRGLGEETAGHACHIAMILDRLRSSGYADQVHCAEIEVALDAAYADLPEVQQRQLAVVKAYRTRHPFTVPDGMRPRDVEWSTDVCRLLHADAEAFLKGVLATDIEIEMMRKQKVQHPAAPYSEPAARSPQG
jgi:hypothetical protein